MGLETGTGIGDLVPANPLSTDAVSSGDDHIRLIKTVMQSITFMKSIQEFVASGTWTRPANVKRVLIYCLGAGGGGGGSAGGASYSGGGGGSGASAIKFLDVSAIASVTVTVGVGGNGGAAGANAGTNGTATSFGVHCVGAGGKAGVAYFAGGDPQPRASSVGDAIFSGAAGQPGNFPPTGAEVFGGMGAGAGGTTNAPAFLNSGGGGGGGASNPSAAVAGGGGGSGYCIVFEYGW